jgi:hypothetical protein
MQKITANHSIRELCKKLPDVSGHFKKLAVLNDQKKAGISHIDATKNGRKVSFAIRTKISILKNHVNGLGYKDGKIIAVPQGYITDTKESLDNYKKEYSDYWETKLGYSDYSLDESDDDSDE